MKHSRVIAMLSGGLDSALAAWLMIQQNLEVIGFHIITPFYANGPDKLDRMQQAEETARRLGMEIHSTVSDDEYLDRIRNPKFGYGRGVNPCLDCRIYMLERAKNLMEQKGALAVVTGDVLGQRPMSQRMDALCRIEKEAGLVGKILRPLSARHFAETEIEKQGIVDRSKLLAISGRGRRQQLEMAQKAGLTGIVCGDAGCLLTDENMKSKLLDLFRHSKSFESRMITRLKIGRHFRLANGTKFILGRNQHENEMLERERGSGEFLVIPEDFPGPTALVESQKSAAMISYVANVVLEFSRNSERKESVVSVTDDNGTANVPVPKQKAEFAPYWITGREIGDTRRTPTRKGGEIMPRGDGTGPAGQGSGTGRGRGRGRVGGPLSAGLGGDCICPRCEHKVPHAPGQPCAQKKCPKCGNAMARDQQ